MTVTTLASKGVHYLRIGLAGLAMFQFTIGAPFANAAAQPKPQTKRDTETTSPIKHVIVIIGENRSFDHVFATYVPKSGAERKQPALRGDHPARHQQERDSRARISRKPNNSSATDIDTSCLILPNSNFPATYCLRPWSAVPVARTAILPAPAPVGVPSLSPGSARKSRKADCPAYHLLSMIWPAAAPA